MLEGETKGHLHWRLCLGPGQELGELLPLLSALIEGRTRRVGPGAGPAAAGSAPAPGARVEQVSDVVELIGRAPSPGRLVLTGDGFPLEDIGLVRRFLANNPHWELVVLGRDSSSPAVRRLLSCDRTRWLAEPPDLDQLRWLVAAPERSPSATGPTGPAPASGVALPAPDCVVAVEVTPPPAPVPAPAAASTDLEPGPVGGPFGDPRGDPRGDPSGSLAPGPELEPEPARPAPDPEAAAALGDYVGPLADLVQRVDLSMGLAREGSPDAQAAAGEVDGLRQMTHMMKRVAAPPPRGGERFDVGALFEERLAAITIQSPRELRFLPRGERGLRVRADRGALSEALASLLALARGCASPSGVVLAPFGPTEDGRVRLELEFPAGPLAGLEPARLLEPGGLGGRVPGLGAADLPAARSVARSQGGELTIVREPGERLRAALELPLEPAG